MSGLVLLTGATGFVGRQILQTLIAQGRWVRLVLREGREHQFVGRLGIESTITTPQLFAENAEWWAATCQDVDTVIHAAWYAEPGKYLQSALNLDCLVGTLQLAQGAALTKVRRFVGLGTCAEYDLTHGWLSTSTPLAPHTLYASCKAAAYQVLSAFLPNAGIAFAWCRLFYLYGEGEDERRLIPYLRTCLAAGKPAELTSGNQIRDYLDVAEVGRMLVSTALSDAQGAVNICSGVPTTIRELAERIADEYGRRDLLKFGARPDNAFDPPCIVGIK